jgi:predicted permease
MLDALLNDARYAARMLRKNPVFTAVAVAVVAIGIASVSAIYTVADAVVLRPIPGVRDPGGMVTIERAQGTGHGSITASYPYYRQLVALSRTMSGIAAWDMITVTVSTGDAGTVAQGNLVTGNYFSVLGVRPQLGRFFAADEDSVPLSRPVLVLSHDYWKRRFDADSAIVGHQILVNGRQFAVIGVAPAGFSGLFPAIRTDVWVPMMMQPVVRPSEGNLLNEVMSGWLQLVGRIAPGSSRAAARAELLHITQQYAATDEAPLLRGAPPFDGLRLTGLSGLPGDAVTPVLAFFAVLLVLSALVLLIASVNVMGMLLVRAVARRREMAVRIALGAGRGRLLRQLLTESVVLFAMGGALGLLLARAATGLLARIPLPNEVALSIDLGLHSRTLLVTLGITLLTGIVFGLAPALRASRTDLTLTLRSDTAGSGRARSRLRTALVAAQISASLMLLTASGLFVRALARGHQVDPGYDISHIGTVAMDVSRSGYDSTRARLFTQQLGDQLRAIPGVTAVGWTRNLPLSMNTSAFGVKVPGYQAPGSSDNELTVNFVTVDPGYFATLHLPVPEGRGIRPTDDAAAPRVVVISRTFAETAWPGKSAVGQSLLLDGENTSVVGIAPDVKFGKLDEPRAPFMYLPLAQHWTSGLTLMVRTTGDPALLAQPIRDAMHRLDPTLPAPVLATLEQSAAVVLLPQRVAAMVTSALGLAGLLLSTIGLYGVVAFSAAQRGREMGIRQALGASRFNVLSLVVGEGMRVVAIGLGVGLLLSLLMTRALAPFLFGVSPLDLVTFATGVTILAAAAFVASWLPARRVARVDPMVALRQE